MGSVNKIETLGLLDGPGVRVVVFLNGCKLRCKFCHNPEMFKMQEQNMTAEELVKKVLRYKPYFKNNGGVTFSGGEPLLQSDFLLECVKLLKKENIHIALDTAGVGSNYDELLDYIDLVIMDIKGLDTKEYEDMTNYDIDDSLDFLREVQSKNKPMWIRQVIVPFVNDNENYIMKLKKFISHLDNVEKVELLPYHILASDKYNNLNIKNPLEGIPSMDKEKCLELEKLLKEKV